MSGPWLLTYVVLWLLVIAMLVVFVGMLRLLGDIQQHVRKPAVLMTEEGVPLGSPAPTFVAEELQSEQRIDFPPAKKRAIVAFLSTTCEPCQKLVASLNSFWEEERAGTAFFIVCTGSREQVSEFAKTFQAHFPLLVDPGDEIARQFGHQRTPFAYLVDKVGLVRMKGIVNEEQTLRSLLDGRGQRISEGAWHRREPEPEPARVSAN